MLQRPLALLAAAFLATAALSGAAGAQSSFSPAQQEEIERLVHQYILENPEVILDALRALEQKQAAAAETARGGAIEAAYQDLAWHADSPVVGNPKGDVVIVEFFDYNCGYCRKITEDLFALTEDDGGIRYVLKELPIFGQGSRFAAKAALAAARQGKYAELHLALMTSGVQVDESSTLAIAASIGLDMERLQDDMLDPALDAELERNARLARALGVEGTPAMVIGKTFVPGARPYAELERLVAAARAGKS